MANAHWRHHNHFGHYGLPGFDMLHTGYAAKLNPENSLQAAFEFDDVAKSASNDAMLSQIPSMLAKHPDGVSFGTFFLHNINTTPATRRMVQDSILELVRGKEVHVVGEVGEKRNVRTDLRDEHILRLPAQKSFLFSSGQHKSTAFIDKVLTSPNNNVH